MGNKISIGAAYKDQDLDGSTITNATITASTITGSTLAGASVATTAGITSSGATGAGIGYATGAGGTVTQATNRTTGVTINKLSGAITTHTASLGAELSAAFIVTNSTVAIGDVPVVAIRSGNDNLQTGVHVSIVTAGTFSITVTNHTAAAGAAETGAIIINFAVIKAVSA